MTDRAPGRPPGGSASAAERAYDVIRQAILGGTYAPGSPLREEELAEVVGVSRTPVREALRRLDAEGLIDFYPNRGASVAAWSEHELDEIFGLRLRLEGYGARLAALAIGDEDLATLAKLADEIERSAARRDRSRLERVAELNNEFHRCVLEAGGNRRLSVLMGTVIQRALVEHTFHLYSPEELSRSFNHHREIVAALSYHDPDWAESVMHAHILAGRRVLKGAGSPSGEEG
ncbi:MAG: GntR family transcriptional regulator [Acidimicrobiales bacterium]